MPRALWPVWLPGDIAEVFYFLAGDQSAKSTGNMINVDAGNA
ncbi:short chain dehydrogenase, partial [Sphingomonas sp. LH128]